MFSLGLVIFLFVAFTAFKNHYNGLRETKEALAHSQTLLEQEKIKTAIAYYELENMRQNVATILPKNTISENYPVRALASISRETKNKPLEEFASTTVFNKAKEEFRAKNYKKSNALFTQMIHDYKYSIHLPEAHFLLIEGLYQAGEFETCLKELDVMVSQFPENELTGFSMIRMGQIFEKRERLEEAKSVYQSVLRSFENKELKKQAQISLEKLDL